MKILSSLLIFVFFLTTCIYPPIVHASGITRNTWSIGQKVSLSTIITSGQAIDVVHFRLNKGKPYMVGEISRLTDSTITAPFSGVVFNVTNISLLIFNEQTGEYIDYLSIPGFDERLTNN